jgi:UDP-perosamine 4-acetyltransferase
MNLSADKALLLVGTGGHARVVWELVGLTGRRVVACLERQEPTPERSGFHGSPIVWEATDWQTAYPPTAVALALGVGSVAAGTLRAGLFARYTALGYGLPVLVHPSAVVSSLDVTLGEGVQVMAGAVIQPGCSIAENVIINTRASIDHDCSIGPHVHIAPGVVMSGGVSVGEGSFIGVGAVVRQGIRIAPGVTVGAGSVVVKDLLEPGTYTGCPARKR